MTAAVLRADCGLLCPPLCLSSPAVQTEGGEESNLLRFLAVGRLVSLADGRWAEGKHQLLCFYAPKDDRDVKAYRSHIRAIMNRGAAKLQPGKRIRLTSDNNDYDLHVLADNAAAADGQTDDGDGSGSAPTTLIFFAVTDPSFAKHHTVSSLLRDFKRLFYESVQLRDVLSSSGGVGSSASSSLQRQCQPLLLRLFSTYNASRLREVQAKVEKVKSVMKDNVDKALNNVEHLEELESKSEQFQEHARQFSKSSNKLRNMFRCRYYKINVLLAVLVAAIVAYIIYAIYNKVHG